MDFSVPELGEGVYEAELVSWLVRSGDSIQRGQALMEVLTDKATMEVPSPFAGLVTELRAEPGQMIKVGDVVLTYDSGDAQDSTEQLTSEDTVQAAPAAVGNGQRVAMSPTPAGVRAAPSVRLMARELGVDLTTVNGSGPGGRILVADLSKRLERPASPQEQSKPDFGSPGTTIKLIGLRRKIAEHMVHSKSTAPHYAYVDECDVSDLARLRAALKEPAAEDGVRLTYLAFIAKAVVGALKAVPIVNAMLDDDRGEIVLHDRYNLGFAVATPQGLIVPVVRDADKKDVFTLAREIERLSVAAREGTISRDELQNGTFTITSIGNIGGLFSTPIINHPEVGILGVGKIVKRPVYDENGNIKPAEMLYLSFSFDHRVVDGAVGAAFGNAVMEQLRNPARLLAFSYANGK